MFDINKMKYGCSWLSDTQRLMRLWSAFADTYRNPMDIKKMYSSFWEKKITHMFIVPHLGEKFTV